ncbi:MAG: acyl carrier protein [Bryobacteraceae bacterium]
MSQSVEMEAIHEVVAAMVGRRVGDSDSLISSGLIDSLSILKLISGLEKKLGIKIPTAKVQPDDFETVETVAETIERVSVRP